MYMSNVDAQVAIGKTSIDGDAILDFENQTTKGLILPIVTSLPSGANLQNGTLLMDYTTAKILCFNNGRWRDLTDADGNTSAVSLNPSLETGMGVILGNTTSNAEGVLILESNSKALVLPKINQPHLNVASPYPGMVCYDTNSRTIAMFNGTYWYFWK